MMTNPPPTVDNGACQALLDSLGPPGNDPLHRAGIAQKRLKMALDFQSAGLITTSELGEQAAYATVAALLAVPGQNGFLGAIAVLTNSVADLTNKVADLTNNVANLTNNVANLTNNVANLNNNVTNVTNDVANVTNNVTNLTNDVANLTISVANLTNNVANLTIPVTNVGTNFNGYAANLLNAMTTNHTNMSTNLANVNNSEVPWSWSVNVQNLEIRRKNMTARLNNDKVYAMLLPNGNLPPTTPLNFSLPDEPVTVAQFNNLTSDQLNTILGHYNLPLIPEATRLSRLRWYFGLPAL